MVDALSSGGSECMLVGVQLPPLAHGERPEPKGSGLFVSQAAVWLSSSQHFRQECSRMPNPFHLSLVVSADCTEYGLTGEEFTVNAAGQSYISYADYAIAW